MKVTISKEALDQVAKLPLAMQVRVEAVVQRLEKWPQVSGVKWLAGDWKGYGRIRTGDYRVIFLPASDVEIVVTRIAHRRDAYAD